MFELFLISYFLFGVGLFFSVQELIEDESYTINILGFLLCTLMTPFILGIIFGEWSKTVDAKK